GMGLARQILGSVAVADGHVRERQFAYDPNPGARGRRAGRSDRPQSVDVLVGRTRRVSKRSHGRDEAALVTMRVGHAEAVDGVAFEVEFDQHHWLFADDPAVMARLDGDDLRRLVLDDAAVGVFDMDFATR